MTHTIRHARFGNPLAREQLVERLESRVDTCSRYYARLTGADAEDLRQEMWLGIFAALERVDVRIGDPVQYLLQQGRFALLTYLRRERRVGPSEALLEEPVGQNDVEDEALTSQSVLALLDGLGEPGRRIVGFLLAGHSRSDVARLLRCSPANVTYHLRRVEAQLGSMLALKEARSA
jgi:RNA polymerase sigma factor (sigma-70 family)